MKWMSIISTPILAMFIAVISIIITIAVILLLVDDFELYRLGNTSIFVGLGCVIIGLILSNFRRTSVDVHVRHQGSKFQKKQKVDEDLAEFSRAHQIMIIGVVCAIVGWLFLISA